MPKNPNIKKVLVLGSGPIVIGQAAEFDYAGTQACRALKEEGVEVVLVNSNPATIMTDKDMADQVYIEPLTLDVVKQHHRKAEKPDGLLLHPGRTDRPDPVDAAGHGTASWLSTMCVCWAPSAPTIDKAEDRQMFKDTMEKIGQPCIPSEVVETLEDAVDFTEEIGLPVIIRPAFTMGGTGGGIANTMEELHADRRRMACAFRPWARSWWRSASPAGRRSSSRSCGIAPATSITVCSMENIDPVGVHTGDSIVVAPAADPGRPRSSSMLRDRRHRTSSPSWASRAAATVQFALKPRLLRVCRHRGKPPRVPFLGTGLQGHRLPHRQGGRQDRHRLHAWTRSATQ